MSNGEKPEKYKVQWRTKGTTGAEHFKTLGVVSRRDPIWPLEAQLLPRNRPKAQLRNLDT